MGLILSLAAVLTLRQLALAAFSLGDDSPEERGAMNMDGQKGQQTWYHGARGGRGMCSTHGDCNARGICHRGICVCSVLWGGGHCDRALDVPSAAGLPRFFTHLSTPFRGSFALSRINVGRVRPQATSVNPIKCTLSPDCRFKNVRMTRSPVAGTTMTSCGVCLPCRSTTRLVDATPPVPVVVCCNVVWSVDGCER